MHKTNGSVRVADVLGPGCCALEPGAKAVERQDLSPMCKEAVAGAASGAKAW